jgi:hypothetical protein
MVQTKQKGFNNDECDEFMADSIKEAEQEYDKKTPYSDNIKDSLIKAEEEPKPDLSSEESNAKRIKQMTQDLIDGAMTTQSKVTYNGSDVDVQMFGSEGTNDAKEEHKLAVKAALKELTGGTEPVANVTKAAA